METFLIISIPIVLLVLFALARSAQREADRMNIELEFRVGSLEEKLKSIKHLVDDDDREYEISERKADRLKARAEEVASRQAPGWKLFSRTVNKRKS